MADVACRAGRPPNPRRLCRSSRSTSIETVAALRIVLAEIIADRALADARDVLFLTDIIPGGTERFDTVRMIEIAAIAAGYPVLQ